MGFTEAYDQVRTELKALFPTYNEIDNPYDVEKNADINLREGFGIALGPAINTTKAMCKRLDINRTFTIVLCRRANATKNDTATRITTEKALFEDLTSIVKMFEQKIANVKLARYDSDAGVEFVGFDRYNYYVLKADFNVEYSEFF